MLTLPLILACSTEPRPKIEPEAQPELAPVPASESQTGPFGVPLGEWNGEFGSKGGRFPFRFRLGQNCETTLLVAGQEIPTTARCEDGNLSMRFPPYLGSLTARIETDAFTTLRGQWNFQRGGEWHHLDFRAEPGPGHLWAVPPEGVPDSISLQIEGGGTALLELHPAPNGAFASMSAPTGDWGPLEGGWTADGLQLSGFDGSHAFLVKLAPDSNGRFSGHYWSKDGEARGLVETDDLADLDGWDAVDLDTVDLGGVELKRIGGEIEALPTGGPRIVHLTGTWCPNCNDAAPVIEGLAKEFPGVTVLGLSWEAGAVPGKADRQIRQFRDRHRVTHPLYRLDSAPPFLDPVPAWPTTLFVAADGTVTAAHVGFLGPATGKRFTSLVERYRAEAGRLAGR